MSEQSENRDTPNTLNTKDIIDGIHETWEQHGLSKNKEQSKLLVNSLISHLLEQIKKGFKVRLINFGTLKIVTRAPKHGRNPITGEYVTIPEKKSISFKISQNLYKSLNEKNAGSE